MSNEREKIGEFGLALAALTVGVIDCSLGFGSLEELRSIRRSLSVQANHFRTPFVELPADDSPATEALRIGFEAYHSFSKHIEAASGVRNSNIFRASFLAAFLVRGVNGGMPSEVRASVVAGIEEASQLLLPDLELAVFLNAPSGTSLTRFISHIVSEPARVGESTVPHNGAEMTRPLVVTLHGIRTRGKWQKELVPFLEEKGFRTRPLDYGWFGALSFFVPSLRKRKINWLEEELSKYDYPVNIVAHSFGSYLICKALANTNRINLGTVVLCGSIVKRNFPWGELIDSGRVKRVLNDFGTRDIYAGLVSLVVGDAGDSGKVGFSSTRIKQRKFLNWSHSEFFKTEIYKDWSDFLSEKDVGTPPYPEHPTMGWLLKLLVVVGMLVLGEFVTRPVPIDVNRDDTYWVRSSDLSVWEQGMLSECDSEGFGARPAFIDVGRSTGDGVPLYSERVEVVDVFSSIWFTEWSRVRVKIKPIELEGFRTLYTYDYRDSCKGYFLAKDNAWREWTPSDSGESCINTNFEFSETLRDTEYVYLKRVDGMMIRIPYVKGYSQIESLGGADLSNHYLVTPRFCKGEFGPRGPVPDLTGNNWQYGGANGSGSIVQMQHRLQITLTWNVSGNYAQYTIDAVLSERSSGKFVFEGGWNKAGFAPGNEGNLEGEVISNDRIRINIVTGGEIASISNLEGVEVFRSNN